MGRIAIACLLLLMCACAPIAMMDERRQDDSVIVVSDRYVDAAPGVKSMYRTSATAAGNHNADDSPGSYCATGYHFCTTTEIHGRIIEVSGTGRSTTPCDAGGWLDGAGAYDCVDWSDSSTASGIYLRCGYTQGNQFNSAYTGSCSGSYGIWCCQD